MNGEQNLLVTCHVWHLGRGANRATGLGGVGCNCKENILFLNSHQHDILDGRKQDEDVERIKKENANAWSTLPPSYRLKIAFGIVFRKVAEIEMAMKHHEERMQNKSSCTKLSQLQ